MKRLSLIAVVTVLAGCSHAQTPASTVATVNIARITQNWPKFINYNNQITADEATIERESAPDAQKRRQLAELQARYVKLQGEVTDDVRAAATQVAHDRQFSLVVTQEFVGAGGTDITSDVEKFLKITETATPTP